MTPERREALAYLHAKDGCPYAGSRKPCPACNAPPVPVPVMHRPTDEAKAPAEFCVSPEVQAQADEYERQIEESRASELRALQLGNPV